MGILQGYSVERLERLIADCREEIERYERVTAENGPCAVRRQIVSSLQRERALYIVELGNRS